MELNSLMSHYSVCFYSNIINWISKNKPESITTDVYLRWCFRAEPVIMKLGERLNCDYFYNKVKERFAAKQKR